MKDVTSVSLLRRVRDASDSSAWSEFASLYEELIRTWLRHQGVLPQDADDIVQEVMSFAHREISNFEHNGRSGAFRRWLRQVTVNRMRDFWRARDRRRRREGPDIGSLAEQLADDHSNLSQLWREEHDRYVVEHLLARVSEQFQAKSLIAFRKIVLEERSAQEVATELGMSVGAARVAQCRVLAALKQLGEGMIE